MLSKWNTLSPRKHYHPPTNDLSLEHTKVETKPNDALDQPRHPIPGRKPLIRAHSLLSGSFPLSPGSACTSATSLTLSRSSSSASSTGTAGDVETSSVMDDTTTANPPVIRPSKEPTLFARDVEHKGVQRILNALTEKEKRQLSDPDMPLRHFRAEKGDADKALQRLRSTLKWKQEFAVRDIVSCFDDDGVDAHNFYEETESLETNGKLRKKKEMQDILREENKTGKIYVRGYDKVSLNWINGKIFLLIS